MRILIVKTSSLGDLVHTLPALTEASAALPDLTCDWVVEESFAELPMWHPVVREVIPVALRRWRREGRKALAGEISEFLQHLRGRSYDWVIDAQGLLKSMILTLLARGPGAGFDARSAREPWMVWSYRKRVAVPQGLHAIERVRRLFAAVLGYPLADTLPPYGIRLPAPLPFSGRPYLLLLHATTWPSKHWPVVYWGELARLAITQGYHVLLPWHAPEERLQAERIVEIAQCGELLPRQGLTGLARWLAEAAGVVGVDTGLAHLTAAVGTPAVTLYGPTATDLTGAVGIRQRNLTVDYSCAPCRRRVCTMSSAAPLRPVCFTTLEPSLVWETLQYCMESDSREVR